MIVFWGKWNWINVNLLQMDLKCIITESARKEH